MYKNVSLYWKTSGIHSRTSTLIAGLLTWTPLAPLWVRPTLRAAKPHRVRRRLRSPQLIVRQRLLKATAEKSLAQTR